MILHRFRKFINRLKIRRIHRDAFLVGTLTGFIIEKILNRKLTSKEYKRLYLAGSITPIYDKFFDDNRYESKYLLEITKNPHLASDSDNYEYCYKKLSMSLLSIKFKNAKFDKAIQRAFESQLESRRQELQIHADEIEKITIEKGGSASVFYAFSTDIEFEENQSEIIYWFGVLVQLLDDIFDLHRDLKEQHNTLATIHINFPETIKNKLTQVLNKNLSIIEYSSLSSTSKKALSEFYNFFSFPAFAYIDLLNKHSKNASLIENGELKNEFCWKGWSYNNIISTINYINSN